MAIERLATKARLMDYHAVYIAAINKLKKPVKYVTEYSISMALLGDFKVEMDGIYNSVIAVKCLYGD